MTAVERRVTVVLAGLFSVRMLGLFMLLPVLAIHVGRLDAATPLLIGLAVGAYGITQAGLQIPFGLLSDRIGRKPVIIGGLVVFAAGSALAAMSDSVAGIIAGRALQGAGAISASATALLADQTRPAVRTRAMAVVGFSIGGSFVLSLVLGPMLSAVIGVEGLFWFTALLALVALALVILTVDEPASLVSEVRMPRSGFVAVLEDRVLLSLDLGVFLLHFMLTATFVAIPLVLDGVIGLALAQHWKLYLGVMLASLVWTVPLILISERLGASRAMMVVAIAGLAAAQGLLWAVHGGLWGIAASLWIFFGAFNFLEARLPALISQRAPRAQRGAALGSFATSQFLGAFAGGVLGGWLLGAAGTGGVFLMCAAAAAVWALIMATAKIA